MDRQTQFKEREKNILNMAEQLLLESGNGDMTLDSLAENLELAKGTLYKHFQSKDELFLQLIIRYEKQQYEVIDIEDDPSAVISRIVLFHLLEPQKTMLLQQLEERLAASAKGLGRQFSQLYHYRKERMKRMIKITDEYLTQQNSSLTTRDYLACIWSIGQGGASMLNSSFYQRYLGSRETLRLSMVQQILDLPSNYTQTNTKHHRDNNSIHSPMS